MIDREVARSLAEQERDIKRLRSQAAATDEAVAANADAVAAKADAVHGHLASDVVPISPPWTGNLLGATGTVQDVLDFIDAASLGGSGGGADIATVRATVSLRV